MQQKLIAFIGGGNMAQAIVLGLLKQGYPADKIIVNDPNEEKRAFFCSIWHLRFDRQRAIHQTIPSCVICG